MEQSRVLLVPAGCGFFSIFVNILDDALENEQVGAALTRELDAIAVVPLDRAAKRLAIIENHDHRGMALHLLDPVEVLGVGRLRGRRLLAGSGPIV